MGRQRKKLGPGELPDRRHWPKLPVPLQQEIFLYLMHYQNAAQQAADRAKQTCDLHPEELGFRNHWQYWSNAVSIIAWLISRLPNRQQYLAVIQRQEEERLWQAASGAGISSGAGSSEKPSASGASTGPPPTPGPGSGPSLPSATRKRRRTA
jgi:hypothetical protein